MVTFPGVDIATLQLLPSKVTEAHVCVCVCVCEQLAQGRYLAVEWPGVEPSTSRVTSQRLNIHATQATQ